jgi:hypothetical protein
MIRHEYLLSTLLLAGALATSLFVAPVQASMTYHGRDLMLCFRQQGASSELEVNVGSVTNYLGLAPGTVIQVNQFNSAQLSQTFFNLDGVAWSVSTCVYQDPSETNFPSSTLWVTRARTDISSQSSPWLRKSSFAQGGTAARTAGLGQGAATYSGGQPPDPLLNTTTAVIVPAGNVLAASAYLGTLGNFQNTFQGNVENTTPQDFSSSGQPTRSDLYQLEPGSGATLNSPGTYLGYFEFKADGTMTFNAAGDTSIPSPQISSITRAGGVTTVSFTTVAGATYGMRFTNSAGLTAPVASWPSIGSTVTGTGAVMSLQDISRSDPFRFYVITADSAASGVASVAPAAPKVQTDFAVSELDLSVTYWQHLVSVAWRGRVGLENSLRTRVWERVEAGAEL